MSTFLFIFSSFWNPVSKKVFVIHFNVEGSACNHICEQDWCKNPIERRKKGGGKFVCLYLWEWMMSLGFFDEMHTMLSKKLKIYPSKHLHSEKRMSSFSVIFSRNILLPCSSCFRGWILFVPKTHLVNFCARNLMETKSSFHFSTTDISLKRFIQWLRNIYTWISDFKSQRL